MNFFDTMKAVFGAIWNMFGLQLRFGQYSFTLGAMFIGLLLSPALSLCYIICLMVINMLDFSVYLFLCFIIMLILWHYNKKGY